MAGAEHWRVGVLFSGTGATSVIESTQLAATLLAIEEINAAGGVLDQPLAPVPLDPGSQPERFHSLADRLLDDGVHVIFGCYTSSSRKAVLPAIERRNGLLLHPTLCGSAGGHFGAASGLVVLAVCSEPVSAAGAAFIGKEQGNLIIWGGSSARNCPNSAGSSAA